MGSRRGQRASAAIRAGPGQAVTSNAAGRFLQRNAFGDCWRAAVKAAGLPKGTRYHDLRHFYASALIAANLNPKVIHARLRQATIAETMDTYGHLFPTPRTSAAAPSRTRSQVLWRNRNGTGRPGDRASAGQGQIRGRAGL